MLKEIQLGFGDKLIVSEISMLWIVKKGKRIRVPTQNGHTTQVFLEEDALLQRIPSKEHKNRYLYLTRVPVRVGKDVNSDHFQWTIGRGVHIDTYSKPRKIPQKLIHEITLRLREYTQLV